MFCGQPHHIQHAPASIVASAPAKLEIRPLAVSRAARTAR
jgi:hypothetical protein